MYDNVLPKKLRDKIFRELKDKPAKSVKHEAGPDHDQADHGSWARGAAGLSVNQARAVSSYYGNGYSIVNEYLRAGTQPDPGENEFGSVEKFVEHLDLAIEKAGPTAKPYTLYRGISTEYLKSLTPGAVFQEDAFASFSKEPGVAEEFAAPEKHSSGSGLVLQLELPAGSKALDMAKVNFSAGLSDEEEMLLPRGSQFEIISPAIPVTNQDDGDWNETTNYVKIRLIPPTKSIKHEAGPDHDQADHGNWARGGARLNEYDGKFKEAGGTLESKTVVSPKDSRSERGKIERLRNKVIDMRDGLERGSDQDRKLKTIIEGYRMMDLAFQSQVDYSSNSAVITAKDSNGKIVGALSYYAPEDYPQITAQFLGTSHEVAGTGTALMREAMQLALDGNKTFAVLDPLEQARPWYESLGLGPIVTRLDSLGGSKKLYTADPDKLKEILGSPAKP
jgi:hypothetical protein